jgi:copper resistance protein C
MTRSGVRPVASVIVALGLALGGALAVTTPAAAHNFVVESTPAEGETLDALPEEFSVTTNDTLFDAGGERRGFGIVVTDAGGRYYGDGCIAVAGASISTPAALGEPGDYTLTWQVLSSDGHIASGTIPFAWTGTATAEGASTPPDCNGTHPVAGAAAPATDEPDARPGTLDTGTLLWIGGAVLAVLAATGVTLVLVRPRRPPGDG